MFQEKKFLTGVLLLFACIAGLVAFDVIVSDGDSVLVWIGIIGGVVSGSFLLAYILRSKRRRERQIELGVKPPDPNVSYRWLFPSVIGGVVLGSILLPLLGEEALAGLLAFLSTWILIVFGSASYFIWRYA